MPPYVKILLSNRFPRSQVTTRLDASRSLYYGPFRTRASADQFEAQFLDLFQMRRCHEDLEPSPEHPGCVYGEMNLCLRPCQQAVSAEEYASEIERVVRFLSTGGRSLLDTASHARERASQETDFELAARLHKQVEKVDAVLKLRDGLVSEVSRLSGVAVTASVAAGCVELWFMLEGRWLPPVQFPGPSGRGEGGFAGCQAARPGGRARTPPPGGSRTPGAPGAARPLVLLRQPRRRMAPLRGSFRPSIPPARACHLPHGRVQWKSAPLNRRVLNLRLTMLRGVMHLERTLFRHLWSTSPESAMFREPRRQKDRRQGVRARLLAPQWPCRFRQWRPGRLL